MIEFKRLNKNAADVSAFPGVDSAGLTEGTFSKRFGNVYLKTEVPKKGN
jgi:hypothetical protein